MAEGVQDYYATLGVGPGADEAALRHAFRRLARQYHPDVNPAPDAAERFRRVVEAYEVLSDPQRRAAYDAGRGGHGAGRYTPPGADTRGPAGAGEPAAPASPMPPVQGLDRSSTLRVSAELLRTGGVSSLEHRRWERCPRCASAGRVAEDVRCAACEGEGFHGGRLSDPCRTCWGTGTTHTCPECAGRGGLWRAKHIEVQIKPGMHYGQKLRLRGMGDAGQRGGQPGDLYVELAPPLPASVQAIVSSELIQAALRRLEEWLDRFAPYPAP